MALRAEFQMLILACLAKQPINVSLKKKGNVGRNGLTRITKTIDVSQDLKCTEQNLKILVNFYDICETVNFKTYEGIWVL